MQPRYDNSNWQNLISTMVRTGNLKISESTLQILSKFILEYIKQVPKHLIDTGIGNTQTDAIMNVLLRIVGLDIVNISTHFIPNGMKNIIDVVEYYNISSKHSDLKQIPINEIKHISENITYKIVSEMYKSVRKSEYTKTINITDLYDVLFITDDASYFESGQPFIITNSNVAKKLLKSVFLSLSDVMTMVGRKSNSLHKICNLGNLWIYVSNIISDDEIILGVKPDDDSVGIKLALSNDFLNLNYNIDPSQEYNLKIANLYKIDCIEQKSCYKYLKLK